MEHKIFHLCSGIRPGGGPAGYLYNLHQSSKSIHANFIVDDSNESKIRSNTSYNKIKNIPHFLLKNLLCIKYIISLLGLKATAGEGNVNNYKYVLCHSAPVAARILKRYKKDKVKIGFMPHGPVSYTVETLDDIEAKYGALLFRFVYFRIMSYLENRIFYLADFIVVAAKEGLESYSDIKVSYEHKLFEVTTGLPPLMCDIPQNEIRERLDIPRDKFVVGFFGRYNYHKGYDYFYDELELTKNENILFISAGIGPITKEERTNYKNYGWRTDINELIYACDIVVIPNRHTYFDLLPLECLSLSRPVAVSFIGGNKKLCDLTQAAIPFNLEKGELSNLLKKLSSDKIYYNRFNKNAKTSFEQIFTSAKFVEGHNNLFSSLDDYFLRKNNGRS
ncbi:MULTISPECIES: glycosyltransferase [Citrobacter]|uniref:glycosyltransferase n=1 Tax=Citrobacter TaxID=544 RepID=UPI000F63664C|nr:MULTISPECIES: glycosyltransferase [Citrobacter]EHU7373403.1 glycosyltransferase family 4 protein [Citrobacter freundii]RRN88510.1 glycosyltransferase [Morganella morganii]MCH2696936.1 glycosyltransferase family 4 protein [Citrobacter portucalensis]MDG9955826.1 glycosyltransferase [Citrobacter portucalensis]MDM2769349.1 glycosyltransferase [Citrobacter sp. Cpo147]